MIQLPEQQITNKINVLIFGLCDSGKTELLKALKNENQKINENVYDEDLDSEEDEEEAMDKFEGDQYSSQVTRCQYNSDQCNIYFEESKNYFSHDFLSKAPNFEVLMFLFNAQIGIFENQLDNNFHFNLEAIRLLKQNYKIIFVITNMNSCNWSKERFEYIQNKLSSLIVDLQFTVIPIDSKSFTNIINKDCQWYEGNSLIGEISTMKINNFQNILRIRVLNISKVRNSTYECKVLSGQLNQIQIPLHFYSIMQKTAVQVIGIIDLINNIQYNIAQNDLIQIVMNLNTKLQIGDILSLPHQAPCFLSKEILAEIQLETQKQSLIITSGYSGLLNFNGIQTLFEVTNVEYINIDGKKQTQEFLKSKQSGGVKLKLAEPFCLEKYNVFFELGHFLILTNDQQTIGSGNVLKVKPL
ncbi:unnamed protein product [Paramecium primaurelia]|uniref:GTP-eEF1A C-terminal domain-containing protein n=1 Tax=Paramecium primaurelia TaxID=5886 RepID=A0A8S1K2I2_PARPR|nr:unnamed protein product [Paramecium primaurelia]